MAKAAKAKKVLKGKSPASGGDADGGAGRSVVWLSGLACGVLAAVAPGLATLVGGLLIPGVVALKLDRERGRPVARTVLTFGLAGCVQPVILLWNSGQSFDAAVAIVSNPRILGVAWSAAAAGWLMTQLVPLGIRAMLEAAALARITRLKAVRGKLVEVWGVEQPTEP